MRHRTPHLPTRAEASAPRRRAARWSLAGLAALLASACSPAAPLNLLTWPQGFDVTRSVGYGDDPRQTLDVYAPTGARQAPVVAFFYGGSWQGGEKDTYYFVAAELARRGYVTIVPDYRVYPQVRYPDFVDDGARAVRWAKDNAARFGGDPDKLFVMGHSAGAYIAAMLALDGRRLGKVGMTPANDIAGLVGISGPYDFLPLRDETLKVIFGGANRPETQPISYVTRGAPPALLVTGTDDSTVDPGNASRLAARMRETGNRAEVIRYDGVGHLTIIGAMAPLLRFVAPVAADTDAFISKIVAGRAGPRARRSPGSPS